MSEVRLESPPLHVKSHDHSGLFATGVHLSHLSIQTGDEVAAMLHIIAGSASLVPGR